MQEKGLLGKLVGKMILRTVRARFRNVYWVPPTDVPEQCIFVANHHGWHDGYIMFQVVKALNRPSLDWIQEYDSFPLFGKVGGMPFPLGDATKRAATIKSTIRQMRDEGKSLMLFENGVLHRGPEVTEIGKSVDLILRKVPTAVVVPVAIRYEMGIHERPEVFVRLGEPLNSEQDVRSVAKMHIEKLLNDQSEQNWQVLTAGTPDVNERWDARKFREKS
jgi:1-acyl-sn-glycerol-3-phosphate acyltransferase